MAELLVRGTLENRRLRYTGTVDEDIHGPYRIFLETGGRREGGQREDWFGYFVGLGVVPHALGLGTECGLYGLGRRDVEPDEAVTRRSVTAVSGAGEWPVGVEQGLEMGPGVEGGAAEEGQDGAFGGKGLGHAGADDARGADDDAVLAGEAESHDGRFFPQGETPPTNLCGLSPAGPGGLS